MTLISNTVRMLGKAWLVPGMALVFFMYGCGFHLRGSFELPPGLENIAIDDTETTSDIAPVLKTHLRRHNITPLNNIEDAKLVIVIDSEKQQRRVMTVSSAGRVQEFELIYTVSYSLLNKETPEASVSGQTLTLTRDLRFDETAVLGVTSEETRLQQEMLNASAEQILRRLQNVAGAKPVKGN
ncbi:MAG TPA: LPS assembly lipoprotein LptE [Gammaproteobacteria bacterium]